MDPLNGEETLTQILTALAQAVWPQGTPTRPDDITRGLRDLAQTEAREPLMRAARFVELAAERGDSSTGRYSARQAHGVIECYLRGDFKGKSWDEAFEELCRVNAMRRASWEQEVYVDVSFPSDPAMLKADPEGYPYRDDSGNAFRLKEWPEGVEYTPSEADRSATDWALA